ncbi:hypothetical protein GCM10008090_27550 [Arenicella chitinivorans]|uniref:Right handed beta helix domain-containing protein n=2 Tax=Arenicella chitinivorans TaxID=1329800 RepID=A0A918RYR9_9GAMM|nr:hypothetical protein GCM10008090_27550 [Arenicella chitinivorans]
MNDLAITPAAGELGFSIEADSISVVFEKLQLSGADRPRQFGGAVSINSNHANVNFDSVRFSQNSARLGSSILSFSSSDTSITIVSSEFNDNVARNEGAALYTVGDDLVQIADTSFTGNRGMVGADPFSEVFSGGAAIYIENADNLSLVKSTFTNNGLDGVDSVETYGGAVLIDNGGGMLNIDRNRFSQNSVGAGDGGALSIRGSLTGVVVENTFTKNTARFGGGIHIDQTGSTTDFNLIANTFSENSAVDGGAMHVDTSATSFINNTLVSNVATSAGGAMYVDGGLDNKLTNNTLISNQTQGDGGAIYLNSTSVAFENNLLMLNRADNDGADIIANSTTFTSFSGNLIGDAGVSTQDSLDGFVAPPGTLLGTSDSARPLALSDVLDPASTNNGTTFFIPTESSVAVDGGVNTNCPFSDQRGRLRDDGHCDIGAIELRPSDISKRTNLFVIPLRQGRSVVIVL